MRSLMVIMLLSIVCLACPFFFLPCQCVKCRQEKLEKVDPSVDEWKQGDFITLRRIYPHQRCGGQMIFNGHSERASYSEKDTFYDHVCDRCSTTNQILNQTWPQFKREWRSK